MKRDEEYGSTEAYEEPAIYEEHRRHSDAPVDIKCDEDPNADREEDTRRRGAHSMSILVRNMSMNTSSDALRALFEHYGEVRDIYLPLTHENREPRGFGFVEFVHAEEGQKAIDSLDNTEVDGNLITCVEAQRGRKTPEEMRFRERRPRGGYRGGRRDRDGPSRYDGGGPDDDYRRPRRRSPSPYRGRGPETDRYYDRRPPQDDSRYYERGAPRGGGYNRSDRPIEQRGHRDEPEYRDSGRDYQRREPEWEPRVRYDGGDNFDRRGGRDGGYPPRRDRV
eukprot:GHVH01008160.1.p1 GENE.GHVH01008160.1~~GHVH01008160.1.p1  ORF type:complete len:279 (+),score=38.68 GHVH01008160.1:142-978(+)